MRGLQRDCPHSKAPLALTLMQTMMIGMYQPGVQSVLHQVCAVINLPSLNPTMFSCSYIEFSVLIKVQSVPGGADA